MKIHKYFIKELFSPSVTENISISRNKLLLIGESLILVVIIILTIVYFTQEKMIETRLGDFDPLAESSKQILPMFFKGFKEIGSFSYDVHMIVNDFYKGPEDCQSLTNEIIESYYTTYWVISDEYQYYDYNSVIQQDLIGGYVVKYFDYDDDDDIMELFNCTKLGYNNSEHWQHTIMIHDFLDNKMNINCDYDLFINVQESNMDTQTLTLFRAFVVKMRDLMTVDAQVICTNFNNNTPRFLNTYVSKMSFLSLLSQTYAIFTLTISIIAVINSQFLNIGLMRLSSDQLPIESHLSTSNSPEMPTLINPKKPTNEIPK
jgi:hypothetical protein